MSSFDNGGRTFGYTFAMPSPYETGDQGHIEDQQSRSDYCYDNNQHFGHVPWTHFQVTGFLS